MMSSSASYSSSAAAAAVTKVLKLSFQDVRHLVKIAVPPLAGKSHKGQHGRTGVVGGSADYTGAPYYAAESALKFGGDLSFVFCAQQAAIPLKSYSPELMVTPFYDADSIENKSKEVRSVADKVTSSFDRLHGIVFGPGLGRFHVVGNTALLMIIGDARAANLPLVIDADGLWLITHHLAAIKHYKSCILTPNAVEFDRLVSAALSDLSSTSPAPQKASSNDKKDSKKDDTDNRSDNSSRTTEEEEACAAVSDNTVPSEATVIGLLNSSDSADKLLGLSRHLGVTVLRKAANDMVSDGQIVVKIDEDGSPRRCGGQGDILSGCLGIALGWAEKRSKEINEDSNNPHKLSPPIVAAMMASSVVRRASILAFAEHHRSMTSPNIMEKLGQAFYELIDRSDGDK